MEVGADMSIRLISIILLCAGAAIADKRLPGPREVLQTAGVQEARFCHIQTLRDSNPFVREASAKICGETKDRSTIGGLQEILDNDDYVFARIAAGRSLLLIGQRSAAARLTSIAAEQIASIAWDIVGALAGAGEADLALTLADQTLARENEPRDLIRALMGLEAFASVNDARALQRLSRVYEAGNSTVRIRATEAIEKFKGVAGSAQLASTLLRTETDPDVRLRLERILKQL
jgi:HEAT repeat protein